MKKYQERLYQKYVNATATSVCEVYSNPSVNKIRAEMRIKEFMLEIEGENYKVTSHNCNYFSCAFVYYSEDSETGELTKHLRYYTGQNVYDFIID